MRNLLHRLPLYVEIVYCIHCLTPKHGCSPEDLDLISFSLQPSWGSVNSTPARVYTVVNRSPVFLLAACLYDRVASSEICLVPCTVTACSSFKRKRKSGRDVRGTTTTFCSKESRKVRTGCRGRGEITGSLKKTASRVRSKCGMLEAERTGAGP